MTFGAAGLNAQGRQPGAQPQGMIVGTVSDSTGSGPLAGATVTVRNATDSSIVAGAIAERDGSFSIGGLRPGQYYVRVSYVGYVAGMVGGINITPGNQRAALGTIRLAADASVGADVVVNAQREFMSIGIDRTSYKTSDLKVAAGGTVSDLLRNIPAIDVDADGNVSLRGSQNVVIQLNGRPTMMTGASLAAFLRSLPSDAVERVEVIPNPSAKYDPDGLSGIINIVLKQSTERGLSGGVNGAIGTDPNGTLGLFIGYGSGPWNIYANYGFNYERMMGDNGRVRVNQTDNPGQPPRLDQDGFDTSYTRSHTFNANIEYALGGGHSISYTPVFVKRDVPGDMGVNYIESNTNGDVLRRYVRSNDNNRDGFGMDHRFGYKWTLEPRKHELSAEVRYARDNDSTGNGYLTRDFDAAGAAVPGSDFRSRTWTHDINSNMAGQVDYVNSIGENGRLELGYKGDIDKLESEYRSELFDTTSGTFVNNVQASNSFDYERKINSAYATYQHTFGDFGAQAGLRAENATSTFTLKNTNEKFNSEYFSLFPSAFVTYSPIEALQLKASYSRRINRPGVGQLNPFPQFEDKTFRMIGNPNLKPEYIDSYDFTAAYFYDKGSVTVNPYYRKQHDLIGRWERYDSLGASVLTFENFSTTDNVGVDVTTSYRPADWLNVFVSGSVFQFELDASNVEANVKQTATQYSFRANVSATIMEGLDVQMMYMYRAPMDIVGGTINAFQFGDLAIVQKLFDNKATVGLRVSDVFKTMGFSIDRTYAGYYQTFERLWNSRTLNLTFSYTFGSPVRPPRPRQQDGGGQSINPVGM